MVSLWLRMRGWKIICRNYQNPLGEIDLIASRGSMLCAFEVKFRKKAVDDPVSHRQKQRIQQSFLSYIAQQKCSFLEYRIDLVIYQPPFHFTHIKNAWS